MSKIKPYYKKNVSYRHDKKNLEFQVSQELFSSQTVDHGTQRLLRTLLFKKINNYKKALDLGCGYGPVGLTLKAAQPQSEIHMIDPDALALEYTKANAKLNHLEEIKIYGSLAYDSVTDTNFDLIVSNIPAKVGETILKNILLDAKKYLTTDGKVVIVVIDAIADFVDQQLNQNEDIEILFHRSWPGHHVYHYKFNSISLEKNLTEKTTFESGDFYRHNNDFYIGKTTYKLDVSYNLSEFDQLTFDTELLLKQLETITTKNSNVLCFNPGQGYIPLALSKILTPQKLLIIDRNLLALKTTEHNLKNNSISCLTYHQVTIDCKAKDLDVIVGVLPEKQNIEVYKLLLKDSYKQLKANGTLLLASSSTVITKIEELTKDQKQLKTLHRSRKKGRSVIVLKKAVL